MQAVAAVLQRQRCLEEDYFNVLMEGRQLAPPDRVMLTDADDATRLLLYSLLYPEQPDLISPEWVQRTAEDLCPELTVTKTADLLCRIAEGLKDTHRDRAYSWSRDKAVTDITLIQALSVAADRCRSWVGAQARHP
jgi:hypothetical protein